jgi:hypothetical protein
MKIFIDNSSAFEQGQGPMPSINITISSSLEKYDEKDSNRLVQCSQDSKKSDSQGVRSSKTKKIKKPKAGATKNHPKGRYKQLSPHNVNLIKNRPGSDVPKPKGKMTAKKSNQPLHSDPPPSNSGGMTLFLDLCYFLTTLTHKTGSLTPTQ